MELFLNRGANPNLTSSDGTSPLFMSSQKGFLEIVQLLLKHGADIHKGLKAYNDLPLFVAAGRGHYGKISIFSKFDVIAFQKLSNC